MKIGLVCPYHMFKGGGVREHVNLLYDELVKRGHYVRIITPLPRDYDGPVADHIITIGTSANVKSFLNTQSQFAATVDTDAIDSMLEREKFEILHFHEPFVPILSRQLISRSKCVNIATSHAQIPDRFTSKTIVNVFNPYTRSMLKYMDVFTAVSEPAAEYIKSLTDKEIIIIPNGVDINKYHTEQKPIKQQNVKTILYVGRLEKRKGVKYLLQAYGLLADRRSDVQLLLAGTGPEELSLREDVNEYNIPRVTFLGFISEKEKISHLQRADLFSSAARYGESFGIVLLEAMSAGTPIVAGDNPGYDTVMQGRGQLSIVNSLDAVDYARRMELLLFDEEIRNLWKSWADGYVKQFDYKHMVDKYEKLYEVSLKKRHG